MVCVSSSLHTLVQNAETLLSQAENACSTLRSAQPSERNCIALIQLDQALLDAHDYVQREYDHISNAYGNSVASSGDQTARIQFWVVCTKIDDRITKPLERLAQQFLDHQAHHRHEHGHIHHHCHFCRYYYYHHHHHHHHSSMQWSGVGFLVAKGGHHNGHHESHHYLSEYEAKFQEMSMEWSGIRGLVASCFDELEGRLKKDDKKGVKETDTKGEKSDNKVSGES